MKIIFLALVFVLAFGTKPLHFNQIRAKLKNEDHAQYLVFPVELPEILKPYCGNFDQWAQIVIDEFGGADGELDSEEFNNYMDSIS